MTRPIDNSLNINKKINIIKIIIFPIIKTIKKKIKINKIKKKTILIFTSKISIKIMLKNIKKYKYKIKCLTIGKNTAKTLINFGIKKIMFSKKNITNSEIITKIIKNIKIKKFIFFKSTQGRNLIKNILIKKNIYLEKKLYFIKKIFKNIKKLYKIIKYQNINIIIITSTSILKNVMEFLGINAIILMRKINLLVTSNRIRYYALRLGFKNIYISMGQNNKIIISRAKTIKNNLRPFYDK